MSEDLKIKIEPVCDNSNQIESVDCIVNNIKKEPEVEFVLILPPRQVKIEKVEEDENQTPSKEKKFQCKQCPKSFEKQKMLNDHSRVHKPQLTCQICFKKICKINFKAHLIRHENIRKFYCDLCSAGFVMKADLVQHMWTHRSEKKFNCTNCNRGFNSSNNFRLHLQSHSNNPRPFQCDLCPKNYAGKQELTTHLTAIHSESSLKCNECEFTTKLKNSLRIHKKTVHSSAKPFSCRICKKKFKTKQHVRQHQSVHKTTKDFECKTCGKSFRTQKNLRQHEGRVHGKNLSFLIQTLF
jgi:KRAB domain-containing zinc finger protein